MSKHHRLVDIDYEELLSETDKAYCFAIDNKEVWLPKSLAELDKDSKQVTIPYRIAYEKGLI
jgi:hypothetical protein